MIFTHLDNLLQYMVLDDRGMAGCSPVEVNHQLRHSLSEWYIVHGHPICSLQTQQLCFFNLCNSLQQTRDKGSDCFQNPRNAIRWQWVK